MEEQTNTHSQTPFNQPAITALTHAQPHCTATTATNNAPFRCPIMTSTLALQTSIITHTLLKRND